MNPFTDIRENSIQALGEVALLGRIRTWLGETTPPSPWGMGDDCAVIPREVGQNLNLITHDALIWNVHFDQSVSAKSAGAKLVKRNLSDIAAMGGTPSTAVLGLMMSEDLSIEWLESFFLGIRETAQRYGTKIVGGDMARCPPRTFASHMTLWGWAERPICRSGARAGDFILVTGRLGGSRIKKHHAFEPRLEEGRWLSAQPQTTAMIDLTDGLGKDLPALVPPNCCAHLAIGDIPVSEDARTLSKETGLTPLVHVFSDGEDFELLFSIDGQTDLDAFLETWNFVFETELSQIGRFEYGNKNTPVIDCQTGQPVDFGKGFEYFT